MPFSALRLKKVRRYDVAQRALFLLPVQLLDNTFMECTMNDNSTGLELLQHIAQRLSIGEWQYFGLKFINKHMQYQWLALDQPLKRQLSKFANELFVKFSVRFYIRNINQLKDEFTRYQFFLQLRNEIIEGALLCSAEQAVLLASYSLQAAYGDFDVDRHLPHHLKDFFLLPKRMSVQEEVFFDLLIQVSDTHRSFHGMSSAAAETYYIIEAQNLEGYGEEYYATKDASGNDLLLGTSHAGVTIKHPTGRPLLSITWSNLKSVTLAKKRSICLECGGTGRSSQRVVQIFLENADFSAYVLSNITLQQEFYANDSNSLITTQHVSDTDSRKPSATGIDVKPFGLMFRPDPSGLASVPSYHTADPVNGLKFPRPDVVQFAESYAVRPSSDVPNRSDETESRPATLAYRETPPYEIVSGHLFTAGKDGHSHISTHAAGRDHYANGRHGQPGPTQWKTPFFPGETQAAAVQTSSTPELRCTIANESVHIPKQSISCSTPDLLSMTVPGLLKRPVFPLRNPHSAHTDLQMMRLAALDDLSSTLNSPSRAHLPARTEPRAVFSAVPEEASSRPLSTTAPSDTLRRQTTADSDGTKDARRLDLEQRLSSGNLLIEFEQIPKKRPQNRDSCSVAVQPENTPRNRYPDLLPYDDTRVHLLHPTRKNPKGYINASEIILKCEDLERRYIAAQDPIPDVTSEDFLSMLSQSEVALVVVLSDEPAVPWAGFAHGQKEVSLEGFHLRRESVSQADGFSIICFWLFDRRSKQSRRKVWAIHYHAWTEQAVPESVGQFYRMMQELESLRLEFQSTSGMNGRDSVVIVCRTGSGRTGMMILFDFMRLCLDHNQSVDMARVLTHMRIQRMHMVQTVSQYRFVYSALLQHLAGSRLI